MKIKQIYVINLKRRKDKLKKIMKRLNEIDPDENINIDIFRAVDGVNIDDNYLKKNNIKLSTRWKDPFKNTSINKGEIGCAISHHKIWSDIIKNNYNHALIVEDDGEFSENFIDKCDKIDIPNDTDLIYFGRKKICRKGKKIQ